MHPTIVYYPPLLKDVLGLSGFFTMPFITWLVLSACGHPSTRACVFSLSDCLECVKHFLLVSDLVAHMSHLASTGLNYTRELVTVKAKDQGARLLFAV